MTITLERTFEDMFGDLIEGVPVQEVLKCLLRHVQGLAENDQESAKTIHGINDLHSLWLEVAKPLDEAIGVTQLIEGVSRPRKTMMVESVIEAYQHVASSPDGSLSPVKAWLMAAAYVAEFTARQFYKNGLIEKDDAQSVFTATEGDRRDIERWRREPCESD